MYMRKGASAHPVWTTAICMGDVSVGGSCLPVARRAAKANNNNSITPSSAREKLCTDAVEAVSKHVGFLVE
eukprot:106924-Rhodomonas_salina.1